MFQSLPLLVNSCISKRKRIGMRVYRKSNAARLHEGEELKIARESKISNTEAQYEIPNIVS